MNIKAAGVYLDLLPGEEIEVEKKVKLFEEISTADGDLSYTFELPPTTKNKNALGLVDINIKNKIVYQEIKCDLLNDSGILIYKGFLKVERYVKNIEVTFYSGNSEWISAISGNLKDLDLSEYDLNFTLTLVESTWNNTSGLVFPIVDKGRLDERLSPTLVFDERTLVAGLYLNNDFHPFLFVKNIFDKIFAGANLKISGALLKDAVYQKLVVTNNAGNGRENLEARSSFVGKTTTQTLSSGVYTKITWVDNVDPYYDGTENNFDDTNDRWTADENCIVSTSTVMQFSNTQRFGVAVYKNGSQLSLNDFYPSGGNFKIAGLELLQGDYLEVFAKPFTSNSDVNVGSFFRVTVTKIKKIFAIDVAPNMTKIDFVKNIFKIFNVVTTYNPYTKTVNLELFKNIRNKQPQDLSAYIDNELIEKDYYEFIDEYGQTNNFIYSESSTEEIEEYNETNTIPFGGGSIDLDNPNLQETQTIAELDFVAPYQYMNDAFQMSLIKLNYVGDQETEEDEITSVSDSAGIARFNFSGVPPFSSDDGDIIRIKETSSGNYIGTGVISASGIGFFELEGVEYQGTATGTFVKLNYTESKNEDPVLALYLTNASVSDISTGFSSISVNSDIKSSPVSYAYFFKHQQGGIASDNLIQGLSFGEITGSGFYQKTLIEEYYSDYARVLADPVKVIANFYLPDSIFRGIDFTRPVRLKHKDVGGLYYLNKISGYKASHKPCTIELIKL